MSSPDSPDRESHRPTVYDVDTSVLAVNSTPDSVRTHGNLDETEVVQRGDGEPPDAGGAGSLRGRLDPMPVRVRLHHHQDAARLRQSVAQRADVPREHAEIDVDPGPRGRLVHVGRSGHIGGVG